jgi:DNA-binding NtrC family response regulator
VSELGLGTTFEVYFPLHLRHAETSSVLGNGRDVRLPPGTETILVVEDEAPILDLLGTVLNQAGYKVQSAVDGVEALERIMNGKNRCEAVVLDLDMPRLGGMGVLKILRQNYPRMPVLVISGNLTADMRAELAEFNQQDVMEKPFELARFGQMLRTILDARNTP